MNYNQLVTGCSLHSVIVICGCIPGETAMVWLGCFRLCSTMPGMGDNDRLERFADLVVGVGVNVQPGSFVLLRTDVAHLEIARAVVERAYVAGACWVEVDWSDGPIRRSQLTHAGIDRLTRTRPWVVERTKAWAAERGVSVTLVGDPDPRLLDDVDPVRSRSLTGTHGSRRPACCSITCCSTRTPRATSRGDKASRSRWPAAWR
jgi:leucyl aminopeptidase (aminopeptidase T)